MNEIMTFEENFRMGKYPSPYIYFIKSSTQLLIYFGAKHVFNDGKSFQLDVLKHYFMEFLSITNGEKCVVVYEGLKRHVKPNAQEDEERNHGEMQYVAFLAERYGIQHLCIEPSIKHEVTLLNENFTREEIMTYYFVRSLQNWLLRGRDIPFEEFAKRTLDRYRNESGWIDFDFSLNSFIKMYETVTGEKFDLNNKERILHLENPYNTDNNISKVSRASGEIRDRHIASELGRIWKEGKSIFAVYGMNHAIAQEPFLRGLLNCV